MIVLLQPDYFDLCSVTLPFIVYLKVSDIFVFIVKLLLYCLTLIVVIS